MPAHAEARAHKPITVTAAADGSFKDGRARYGMIVLTKALAHNYPRLARLKSEKQLCDELLAFPENQVFFRLAAMHPNSTKSSYAPETLSAALTQVTCAGDYSIDLIMDNKAAMLDVERVVRGQRSQGRAV